MVHPTKAYLARAGKISIRFLRITVESPSGWKDIDHDPVGGILPSIGPKAQPFAQPRATPWGTGKRRFFSGPTGQRFSSRQGEFLARWADRTTKKWRAFPSPGRCPGLGERLALRADIDGFP
jgi:hypothetical protein